MAILRQKTKPYSALDRNPLSSWSKSTQVAAREPFLISPHHLPLLTLPGPLPPVQVRAHPPRLPLPNELIGRWVSRRHDTWAMRPATNASLMGPRIIRMPTGAIHPPFPTNPIADPQGIRAPNPYLADVLGRRFELPAMHMALRLEPEKAVPPRNSLKARPPPSALGSPETDTDV